MKCRGSTDVRAVGGVLHTGEEAGSRVVEGGWRGANVGMEGPGPDNESRIAGSAR